MEDFVENPPLAELKRHIKLFERLGDALASLLGDLLRIPEHEKDYNIVTTHDGDTYRYDLFLGGEMKDWNNQIFPGLTLAVERMERRRQPTHVITFGMCVKDAAGDFIGVDLAYTSGDWTIHADEYADKNDINRSYPPIYTELLQLLNLQPGEKKEVTRKEAFQVIRRFTDLCHRSMRRELPWIAPPEVTI